MEFKPEEHKTCPHRSREASYTEWASSLNAQHDKSPYDLIGLTEARFIAISACTQLVPGDSSYQSDLPRSIHDSVPFNSPVRRKLRQDSPLTGCWQDLRQKKLTSSWVSNELPSVYDLCVCSADVQKQNWNVLKWVSDSLTNENRLALGRPPLHCVAEISQFQPANPWATWVCNLRFSVAMTIFVYQTQETRKASQTEHDVSTHTEQYCSITSTPGQHTTPQGRCQSIQTNTEVCH